MIITLASSKGGVGKSTMAGCLAGAWAAAGRSVHLIDLDQNKTISRWFRDDKRKPPLTQVDGITVSAPDSGTLTEHLAEIAETRQPDIVLIDVAGTYERALTIAVARSHLTIIPAAPTEADIFEANRIAKHIQSVYAAFGRAPLYRLLLNRVPSLGSSAQLYATLEIVRLKLPRLPTRILQRAAYEEIGLSGKPPHFADRKRPTVAKAVEELDQVRADIEKLLDATYSETAVQGAA